jgi:hypothetical protein
MSVRRAIGRACLAPALAVLAACGVRTDPRPPEDTAARAPEDFEAVRGDAGVELSWERSTKTVDGGRLYDLESFVVERRTGASDTFETIATIPVTDTDRLRTQRTFRFVDADAPAGDDLEYRVRAMTADGEGGVPTMASPAAPSPARDAAPEQPEPEQAR